MDKIFQYLKNYTILCVEDEEGIRKRLVNTLKYYCDEVLESSNGEDGYDLYLEYKPDIIISDIQMPKQDGVAMVEKIRQKDKNTIIIMLSAYSNEEYLLKLINLNINHYILKPINSEKLLEAFRKIFIDDTKNFELSKNCIFNTIKRELYYDDELVNLRKRDKDFLMLLYKNQNQVISYGMIEEYLWRDKAMTVSALKTFIKEFRQRLPFDILENIPQEGYKLKLDRKTH